MSELSEGGREEGGRTGRKEGRGGADTELKTKTPHVNVGKNTKDTMQTVVLYL